MSSETGLYISVFKKSDSFDLDTESPKGGRKQLKDAIRVSVEKRRLLTGESVNDERSDNSQFTAFQIMKNDACTRRINERFFHREG